MTKRNFVPEELLSMFEDTFDRVFPWPDAGDGFEAYWTFRVAKDVAILKCVLRDGLEEEDFEWELTRKTL